jgi:hypothetical protein
MEAPVQVRILLDEVRRPRELIRDLNRLQHELHHRRPPARPRAPRHPRLRGAHHRQARGGRRNQSIPLRGGPSPCTPGLDPRGLLWRSAGSTTAQEPPAKRGAAPHRGHSEADPLAGDGLPRTDGPGARATGRPLWCLKRHLARAVYKTLLRIEFQRQSEMVNIVADMPVAAST